MTYSDLQKKKDYHKKYMKQHYLNNKQYYLDKAKINDKTRIDKNKNFVFRYKRRYGCQDCGIKNPIVLDFHHFKDKINNVATLIRNYGLFKLKDEIRKCILLCANCHRIHHYNKRTKSN